MDIANPPRTDNIEFDTWIQMFTEYIRIMFKGKLSEVIEFTDADATPDVGNGNFFKTANTGATTITMFDGGTNGQIINVLIGDANTTIDFTGTNLKGNGGIGWAPNANDHMVCVYDGTNWLCDTSNNVSTIISATTSTYIGEVLTVTVDDASAVFGSPLYCASDFNYDRTDADAAATMPCVCLALESGSGSKLVLMEGQICDTSWNWSAGAMFVSTTTGELTQTAPSGSGDQVQIVGFALSADTIYFQPNSTVVEIA